MRRSLIAAALALGACAHAGPKSKVVEAEGFAPVDARGLADARDRAVADARRRAVESVAGAQVESTSRVEGAVTTEQRTTSHSRGFVESSTAVEEDTRDGMVRVRVRAKVREGAAPWSTVSLNIPDGPLAAGVARALREKKIETGGGRGAAELSGTAHTMDLPTSLIAGTIAVRANASLLLKGEGSPLHASGAASGLDPDRDGAADKALEAAGYRAGLELAAAMTRVP
ncbi:MAG: flagellar assembly protein T N-terminal domain-containing protein [Elusimicrobia bacterium]|nr:flagellar assembly protein T N-terminal domain-containing protein [Elusimicrobiota bacterium]